MSGAGWPQAPRDGWLETAATLQMWSQIVGKVKLSRAPADNHWWQIALYLTARGLTTSTIPDGNRVFQIDFDFIDHVLIIATSDGRREIMPLASEPLSKFYVEFMRRIAILKIDVRIWPVPVEMIEAVPFADDHGHAEYRSDIARRLWEIMVTADMALKRFRGDFTGKSSPAHLFWGGFDLAMTRFSGRRAPQHPGGIPHLADWVTREAYSHEVWSSGFWPGTAGAFERPAFYAYAYPEPPGFATAKVEPSAAAYSTMLREYLLPYDEVRHLPDPATAVHDFLRSTYEAAADAGHWPRADLERAPPSG